YSVLSIFFPPEQIILVFPAAAHAILSVCEFVNISVFVGGLIFTKSAPSDTATPAAPAIRFGLFSWLIALPRGYIQTIVTKHFAWPCEIILDVCARCSDSYSLPR